MGGRELAGAGEASGARFDSRLADAALAAVTWVGVPTVTALTGGQVTYAGAVPMVTVLGLLLFLRRRWPLTVLLASVGVVMALRTSYLTDAGWVWPASAAYLTVALVRRHGLRWAAAVGVFVLWFAAAWEWAVTGHPAGRAFAVVGAEALWLALLLASAAAYRNWARWRREVVAGLRHERQERELEARRRAAEERLRIAHELHDVVAHTLTVVGVQLRVADEAVDDSPGEARDALRTAQQVRAKAVADLRSLIGVLRGPGASDPGSVPPVEAPQVDLAGIDDLVARTRAGGLVVDLVTDGDPAAVPAPVALAAYRVVQESLTNVVRHAGAARVTVRLDCRPDRVTVDIVDDGAGAPAQPAPLRAAAGHGVAGMRERVTALGGAFSAGPAGASGGGCGGYAVHAEFPVPGFRS